MDAVTCCAIKRTRYLIGSNEPEEIIMHLCDFGKRQNLCACCRLFVAGGNAHPQCKLATAVREKLAPTGL